MTRSLWLGAALVTVRTWFSRTRAAKKVIQIRSTRYLLRTTLLGLGQKVLVMETRRPSMNWTKGSVLVVVRDLDRMTQLLTGDLRIIHPVT
jgi:hypothetical protein